MPAKPPLARPPKPSKAALTPEAKAAYRAQFKPRPRAEKLEIAQWAEATSPQEAAQRFDISTRTVTRYAAEARMAYYLENDLPPEANWGELQVTLARRYAEVAREALELGAAYLKGKEVGNAQRALITAGIATDKAQLLSGNATARKEVSVELQVDSLLSALARIESRVALPRPLDSSIIDVPDKR